MKSLAKLLKTSSYVIPRLVLFGVFMACLFITIAVSFDVISHYHGLAGHGSKQLHRSLR